VVLDVACSVRTGGGEIALSSCMQPPCPWRQDTLAFLVDESGREGRQQDVPDAQ